MLDKCYNVLHTNDPYASGVIITYFHHNKHDGVFLVLIANGGAPMRARAMIAVSFSASTK